MSVSGARGITVPQSGLIRPDLPVRFSTEFTSPGDFGDWDTFTSAGASLFSPSGVFPYSGSHHLRLTFVYPDLAYALKGVAACTECDLELYARVVTHTGLGINEWVALGDVEIAPVTIAAMVGIGNNGSADVPIVQLAGRDVVWSTNYVFAAGAQEAYHKWTLRAGFSSSRSFLKFLIDGVVVAQDSTDADLSACQIDQLGLGTVTYSTSSGTLVVDMDRLIFRTR